jgi:predicted TPR repeat methyltransferase
MSYLKSKSYTNISGVDVSREMVDFCKKCGIVGVSLVDDTRRYLSGKPAAFDLITLNDTIEHLPKEDTVDILKAIRMSLKQGGILSLRTGNFATAAGMYLRYKDFTHEIAYTESSLKQVLRMAGFDDIEIKGNRYYLSGPRSAARLVFLFLWFLILKAVYLIEMGSDKPRIYSKLLIAICRNR